jgi:putative restriction endonuclease
LKKVTFFNGIHHYFKDILDEEGGPMLLHGLKELHGKRIYARRSDRSGPNPDFLDWRYQRFRKAM